MTTATLLSLIGNGADTAVKYDDVAERAGTYRRAVEQAVAAARDAGIPICADDRGLWRAETAADAFYAYRSLRSRALGQLARAAAVKRTAFAMQRAEQHVPEPEPIEQTELWSAA